MSNNQLMVKEFGGDLGLTEDLTWGIDVSARVAQVDGGVLGNPSVVVTERDGTDISDTVLVGGASVSGNVIAQRFIGAALVAASSYRCVVTFDIVAGDDTETQSTELEIRAR